MTKIRFFLEGGADVKLIKDVTLHFFSFGLSKDNFLDTNGYNNNWIHLNTPFFQRAIAEGFQPVIILDANGNFSARKKEIEEAMTKEGLNIPFFLLPDNGGNGNLEDLLLKITQAKHNKVLECFDKYKACIEGYFPPDNKAKVFAYLDALYKDKNKIAGPKRDFLDKEVWDIENPGLNSLVGFLAPFFRV